jgi:hypothetical protein
VRLFRQPLVGLADLEPQEHHARPHSPADRRPDRRRRGAGRPHRASAAAAPPAVPVISPLAGTGQSGYSGDGGPATSATTSAVEDVVRDQRGTTWIADTYNNAVRTVDRRGVISTFVGPEAGLNLPFDLALDPRGRLYVADTYNHRIVRFDAPGATPVVLLDGLRFPSASTSRRTAGSWSPTPSPTACGPGARRVTDDDRGQQHPGGGPDRSHPYDVTASGDAVLIADTGRHRVVEARDGVLTRVAGTGLAGFSGDGGPADQAQLWSPSGIDARPNGSFAVADFRNHRVRLVDVRDDHDRRRQRHGRLVRRRRAGDGRVDQHPRRRVAEPGRTHPDDRGHLRHRVRSVQGQAPLS